MSVFTGKDKLYTHKHFVSYLFSVANMNTVVLHTKNISNIQNTLGLGYVTDTQNSYSIPHKILNQKLTPHNQQKRHH